MDSTHLELLDDILSLPFLGVRLCLLLFTVILYQFGLCLALCLTSCSAAFWLYLVQLIMAFVSSSPRLLPGSLILY